MTTKIKVALVDDHKLFRKGLIELINCFDGFEVVFDANNGKEFIEGIKTHQPDVALIDIAMPVMDGYETAGWIKKNLQSIKILALSMSDNEESIIKMIKCGANGYVLKDSEPDELKFALNTIVLKGFYYSDLVTSALIKNLNSPNDKVTNTAKLNERELEFLKYAGTELTYKEIADRMCVAVRTVDGYREALFEKLGVKSRVGLVIYALNHGLLEK